MAIFDKRIIDPDEGALTGVLGKAMKAANRENRTQTNLMERDAQFWGRFAQDVLRSGPEGRRRSCRGGRAVPEVIAAWWTDPAGRKHVRVIGRTRHRFARMRREVELRSLPPWWHVYPEAVLGVREQNGGERYIAVCRCGAVGSPESLGWMGDTCGPCFDRRADGGTALGGFGQFNEWASHLSRFGFSPDGSQLIGQHLSGAFRTVNRADGTEEVGKRKLINSVIGMATTATGAVVALHDGTVYRWQPGARALALVLPGRRRVWGRVALAPAGGRLTLLADQQAYTADLTAARPQYVRTAFEDFASLRYNFDGSRLLGARYNGELKVLNIERGTSAPVRRDAFDGLPERSRTTEFALTPDGAAVLVRCQSFYPSRVLVRHVPLAGGPMVDLKIPDWHQPTNLAYSPDGLYAITAEAEHGWIGFWDVSDGKSLGFVRTVLEDLSWRGGQIEFSPGGETLAVAYNTSNSEHGTTIAVWPWPETLRVAGQK